MAITIAKAPVDYVGLSTDTKPTTDISAKSTFWESDADTNYVYDGDTWNVTAVGGSANVRVTNQEIDMAAHQENDQIIIGSAAGSTDTWDISWADEMHFDISWDAGADAVTVFTSKDGTNFSPVPRLPWDTNTGVLEAATGLAANGEWRMDLNCKKVRFTKAGTTSTVTINWSAKNTGRSKF